jgi:hypothetical protein
MRHSAQATGVDGIEERASRLRTPAKARDEKTR